MMPEKDSDNIGSNLLLEQYKSLQAETQLRLGEYHKLFFFKMTSAGALLAYVLGKDAPKVGSIIAPLLAVLVDFLIVNNLFLVGVIGRYIRENIETGCFPMDVVGWETAVDKFFFSKSSWSSDYGVIIGSTVVIYLLTCFVLVHYDQLASRVVLSVIIGSGMLVGLDAWNSYQILIAKPCITSPPAQTS